MSTTALIFLVVVFVIILDSRNNAEIEELENRLDKIESTLEQ